jgi:hypothetical protein
MRYSRTRIRNGVQFFVPEIAWNERGCNSPFLYKPVPWTCNAYFWLRHIGLKANLKLKGSEEELLFLCAVDFLV